MSRFFVSQLVRIVDRVGVYMPENRRKFIGGTGPIIALLPEWGCVVVNVRGAWAVAAVENLEPILPERHQACDAEFKRDLDAILNKVKERA